MNTTVKLSALAASFVLFLAVALNACTNPAEVVTPVPVTTTATTTVPTSTSTTSTSATSTPTLSSDSVALAQVALGRALFWDPILSGGKDVACATCHHPANAYTDGLDLSLGENATGYGTARRFIPPNDVPFTKRNAQTVLNTAFNGMNANGQVNPVTAPMFWDSRTSSLELQALGPLTTFEEMRGHAFAEGLALDSLVARLKAIPEYQSLFQRAYGTQNPITTTNIGGAIASFERTLTAMNSPYDRYQNGDRTAMTAQQIQGLQAFTTQGCANCHSGNMFSDYQTHVLTVPDNTKLAASDAGAGGTYAFRTPSLRNVSLTAPYMHSGVFGTLNQVLAFYDRISDGNSQNSQVASQRIDPRLQRGGVPGNAQTQIIAFLNALTDPNFDRTVPASVPSKLNPGGNIR